MERRHLAEANRHIADGQLRIEQFKSAIAGWERAGKNVVSSRRTLALMEDTLLLMIEHRQMIVRTLDTIDRARIGKPCPAPEAIAP
jgi:hypothetical protein